MALIICPECGHEVSNTATDCPNCGHPFVPSPTVNERVLVTERRDREGFPNWILAPLAILAAVVIFLMIAFFGNNEDPNAENVKVNLSTRQQNPESRGTPRVENPPNQIEVPSSSTQINPPTQSTAPNYPPPSSNPSSSTLIPSSQTEIKPNKGVVMIEAKISTKTGTVQSVKNEKFYLLDKDVENILSDAKLEPIEGNSLAGSFGLAVLYPDRYSDFRRDALNAINKHIKYNTTTDGNGKASIKDVAPDSYYLFGITKTKNSFAIWSSPVSIISGENKLNLQPARLNEMSE